MKTFEHFYLKKDFNNALLTLQKHEQDLPRPLWHYNMGTVYAKLDDFPRARYHLMMADSLGLKASELEQNLKFVEERLDVEKLERPISAWDHLVGLTWKASEGLFTAIGLLFLLIGLMVLKKGASWTKAIVLTVIVLLPFALNWWVRSWPRAIVVEPQIILEGPSSIFTSREELPPGVMIFTRQEGAWKQIVWPARYDGWIKDQGLMELE